MTPSNPGEYTSVGELMGASLVDIRLAGSFSGRCASARRSSRLNELCKVRSIPCLVVLVSEQIVQLRSREHLRQQFALVAALAEHLQSSFRRPQGDAKRRQRIEHHAIAHVAQSREV